MKVTMKDGAAVTKSMAMSSAGADSPPPEVFGFGLLCSPIRAGKTVVATVLVNRTAAPVSVEWVNSHVYVATITDREGKVFEMESVLPPPLPMQPPTVVPADGEFVSYFPIDTSKPPFAGALGFDPAKSPYRFDVRLNSTTHKFAASAIVDVWIDGA